MSRDLLSRAIRNVVPNTTSRSTFTGPTSGVAPSQDMGSQMATMGQVSTLFAVIDRLASSVAAVPWRLYRKDPRVDPDARQIIERHPALSVWETPNPHYSQRMLVETIVQHYDLTGEFALWAVHLQNGWPAELWPVRPDRLRPVPDPVQHLLGWVYKGTVDVKLSTTDIIHMRRPNPLDPYRGLSPVGSLIYDLKGEQAAAQWNAMFFQNSARPDGVLEVPTSLTDDEFNRVRQGWADSHQGARNAHRIALLEAGTTFKPMGYSQKDMDFTALRGFSKEQILEAFAFPAFMLGKTDGLARANATASKAAFAELNMSPRLDLVREALNTQFLPQFFGGQARAVDVEFDYENPIPPDAEEERADLQARSSVALSFIAAGFDHDEVLEAFGLPAFTMTEPEPAPQPAAPPPPPPSPDEEPEEPEE